LLSHIRTLTDDKTEPYTVSSDEIIEMGKTRRTRIYYGACYTDDYLTWTFPRDYIEVIHLADGYEGTVLTPSETDVLEGRFVFATAQTGVYFFGYAYDLNDIVSACWLLKADRVDPGITYSLGDEQVDTSKYKQHCIDQYYRYRTSKSGQWRRYR